MLSAKFQYNFSVGSVPPHKYSFPDPLEFNKVWDLSFEVNN